MSQPAPRDLAASVRQRLQNLSRQRGEDPNLVLARYAIERLLYRLSVSPYADRFVLKGALLFALWTGRMHRPTRDLDMLGYGDNSSEALADLFTSLCTESAVADGLQFDPNAILVTEIREDQDYVGHRVYVLAKLGNARIRLHVDIGLGDVVVPAPEEVDYPVLLPGSPRPHLRAYPKETVVAEKLHAMVVRGMANSRMKDFYDLSVMAREFRFDGATLSHAIAATFERRVTPMPEGVPVALTDEFVSDPAKLAQWQAFVKRSALGAPDLQLAQVIGDLRTFLLPLLTASARGAFAKRWLPAGPWT